MKYIYYFVFSLFSLSASAQNSLNFSVRSYLSEEIVDCKQAVEYYLEPSGYALTTEPPAPSEASNILNGKVIDYGKSGDIMTVQDALLRLFDYDIALYVDHENKLVSFGYIKNE